MHLQACRVSKRLNMWQPISGEGTPIIPAWCLKKLLIWLHQARWGYLKVLQCTLHRFYFPHDNLSRNYDLSTLGLFTRGLKHTSAIAGVWCLGNGASAISLQAFTQYSEVRNIPHHTCILPQYSLNEELQVIGKDHACLFILVISFISFISEVRNMHTTRAIVPT